MTNTGNTHHTVRELQAPLRAAYAKHPDQALVVDAAWTEGGDSLDPMFGRVHFGSATTASVDYGVHGAIGGTHIAPVPGDLLCAALASCQESSLRMVANVLGVRILELKVGVRATVDVRGTLGMSTSTPVGFQSMQVSVHLVPDPDTRPLRLSQLIRAAERSCVVLQTLRSGVNITMDLDVPKMNLPRP